MKLIEIQIGRWPIQFHFFSSWNWNTEMKSRQTNLNANLWKQPMLSIQTCMFHTQLNFLVNHIFFQFHLVLSLSLYCLCIYLHLFYCLFLLPSPFLCLYLLPCLLVAGKIHFIKLQISFGWNIFSVNSTLK